MLNTGSIHPRRAMLAAAIAGTAAALPVLPALGQPSDPEKQKRRLEEFPADKAGEAHGDGLDAIKKQIGDTPLSTPPALQKLLDELVRRGLLTPADAKDIAEIIAMLKADKPVSDIKRVADQMHERLLKAKDKSSRLALAIVGIAKNSCLKALEFAKEHRYQIRIVCADIGGALTGAQAGAIFGGPAVAAATAVIGAIAASAYSAFGDEPPRR
ncbi:bacteriocin class II family protein [Rivibacter subsaxonicus]|uniref:Secreted protein n=1 Tax=Rivibacter subsaxonicus TaxID=457575 RepID=A0A4Q7W0F1_9BURK|nr:bacteriocin class II family protein [Rivibacter subsaxonicus]RZU02570.1 hypothetical protein EV670_0598 [Rivibacter subsaxonicus]